MEAPPTGIDASLPAEIRPPEVPPPPPPPRKSGLAFFAVVLALYGIFGTLAQVLNPLLGLAWSQGFALLLPAFIAASGSNLEPGRALLLTRRPAVAAAALAPLIGAAGFLVAGSISQLTSFLLPSRWLEIFDMSKLFERPLLERAALSLAAATVAPFCEEVAFRGWLLTALRTRHTTGAALALSGLLFAVMHLDPVRFSALLALGILYAWLTWRSGSIWPAIIAHATNNGIGVAAATLGGSETSLRAALPQTLQVAGAALFWLVVAGIALRFLAAAYRRATPAPPPIEEALARGDARDPSTAFHFGRLPVAQLVAIAAAVLSLAALALLAAARRG